MTVLRWIAVLPAAAAVSMAAEVVIGLRSAIFNPLEPLFWVNLIKSCVGSGLFVFVGFHVAPKAKLQTALVLAVLMTLLGLGGFWAWFRLRDSFLLTLAVAGPQTVVPVCAYMALRKEQMWCSAV